MTDLTGDRYLDLIGRFVARGANIRPGSMREDMIEHLLTSLEEAETTLRGLEDKLLRLRKDLGD